MGVIYLVCGAGGPQLKRNPLASTSSFLSMAAVRPGSIVNMSSPSFLRRAAVIGVLVVLGQAVGSPALAQASSCLAADDTSARIVNFLAILLTDTTNAGAAERDTVGLSGVAPGQVAPVADGGTCNKIVAALNRFEGVDRPNRKVYAYSVGSSHYAVQDPNLHSGEWTPVFLLDSAFTILRPYLAF